MKRLGELLRSSGFLITAVVIMLTPILFDIEPIGELTEPYKNTRDAIYALVGVLITANLINVWIKQRGEKRDRERFAGVSVVAYRSIAQAVNDAGRMLLAPVIGADLYSSAIPGFGPEDFIHDVKNLRAAKLKTDFLPTTGEWDRDFDLARLEPNLLALCQLPDFPAEMFRRTSRARRLLQESMATWTPVVLNVPGINEPLSGAWKFSEDTVKLLEAWRALMVSRIKEQPTEEHVSTAIAQYLVTIKQYQSWIREIRPRLDLPTPAAPTPEALSEGARRTSRRQ